MSNGRKKRSISPRRQKRQASSDYSEITQISGGTLFTIPKAEIQDAVKMVEIGLQRVQVRRRDIYKTP